MHFFYLLIIAIIVGSWFGYSSWLNASVVRELKNIRDTIEDTRKMIEASKDEDWEVR